MQKFRFAPASLVLALVLGPMVETSPAQPLTLSKGNLSIFFIRPTSPNLFGRMVLFILSPLVR